MQNFCMLVVVTAFALVSGPVRAVELGSPQAGRTYAQKYCTECHEVEAGATFSPNPDAPSFQEVADTPGMTARALAVWFRTSHPTMPNLIIPPDDMDNVIAYILSLRAQR